MLYAGLHVVGWQEWQLQHLLCSLCSVVLAGSGAACQAGDAMPTSDPGRRTALLKDTHTSALPVRPATSSPACCCAGQAAAGRGPVEPHSAPLPAARRTALPQPAPGRRPRTQHRAARPAPLLGGPGCRRLLGRLGGSGQAAAASWRRRACERAQQAQGLCGGVGGGSACAALWRCRSAAAAGPVQPGGPAAG